MYAENRYGGADIAVLTGTSGDDVLTSSLTKSVLVSSTIRQTAVKFFSRYG